jgi:hypothetical protein
MRKPGPQTRLPTIVVPVRRWAQWLVLALLVWSILVLGSQAVFLWRQQQMDDTIATVCAELDHSDPGWRLAEIEAQRAAIPAEENGAPVLIEISQLLQSCGPPFAYENQDIFNEIRILPPFLQLSTTQTEHLQQELQRCQSARLAARRLVFYPHGRFPVDHSWAELKDRYNRQVDTTHAARELLQADVALLAQEGQLVQAWRSCIALWHAATIIGDDPFLRSQYWRSHGLAQALAALERLLAQGEVPDAWLAQMQQRCLAEAEQPLFRMGLRGERAVLQQLFRNAERGNIPAREFPEWRHAHGVPMCFGLFRRTASSRDFRWIHPVVLQACTEALAFADQPDAKRLAGLQKWEAALARRFPQEPRYELLWLTLPACHAFAEEAASYRGNCRCAAVALACERYRQQQHCWPAQLQVLVQEGLLQQLPVDPQDGQPLRYKQSDKGINIYSIGNRKCYNGASLDDPTLEYSPCRSFGNAEFRLWNVDQRRQPHQPCPEQAASVVPEGPAQPPEVDGNKATTHPE